MFSFVCRIGRGVFVGPRFKTGVSRNDNERGLDYSGFFLDTMLAMNVLRCGAA